MKLAREPLAMALSVMAAFFSHSPSRQAAKNARSETEIKLRQVTEKFREAAKAMTERERVSRYQF